MTAGLAAAAVIGVVAVALIDSSGHEKLAAGHLSSSSPDTGSPTAAALGASPGTSPTSSAMPEVRGRATTAPRGDTTAPRRTARRHRRRTATTNPTATSPAAHADADLQARHPGDAGGLPVGRRAVGLAGQHHDLADRARRPGDLVEHRVQRVRHGAAQPLRRNDHRGRDRYRNGHRQRLGDSPDR